MRRLAALLSLAGAAHGDGPAPLDVSAALAHDFATLTDAEARHLECKPALFRVTLDGDSDAEEQGGFTCADCPGDGEPLRSLYLCPGQEAADSMTVQATLSVRFYPAIVGADGNRCAPVGIPPGRGAGSPTCGRRCRGCSAWGRSRRRSDWRSGCRIDGCGAAPEVHRTPSRRPGKPGQQGRRFTVQFGKAGTAGQKQVKEFTDEATALKAHDTLIAEKIAKGYRETGAPAPSPEKATPGSGGPSFQELCDSLPFWPGTAASLDDLTPRLAFADWLHEQGQVGRAEFIRVQCRFGGVRSSYRWAEGAGVPCVRGECHASVRVPRRQVDQVLGH
jgi:uncharacterized protein (TIGR02996 family)